MLHKRVVIGTQGKVAPQLRKLREDSYDAVVLSVAEEYTIDGLGRSLLQHLEVA